MHTATQALAEEVLASRARRNPAWATLAGITTYDHALRRVTREAIAEEAREVEELLAQVEGLPDSLDRDALSTQLSLDLFELLEGRGWARNPDVAAEHFDHLFSLLVAAHLDKEARAAALASRLEGAPAFFRDAWTRTDPKEVPRLFVTGALKSVDGAAAFFDAVEEAAAGTASEARVKAALPPARRVVKEHEDWLTRLHGEAAGDIPLGEERFERLLRLRRIDDAPKALLDLGGRMVERFRAEVREAALTVLAEAGRSPGDDPVAEALDVMRADHPRTFAGVLDAYRSSIEEARAFVASNGLAPMTDVPLDVVETPGFLRHLIPFAAYMGPARFATPRRGVYLVTPKPDLSAFPSADTRNVTVHEAWPGHHLQLSIAAERASLAAFLCEVPDLTEGWALYCEHLMGTRGYTSRPGERLVRARDALWRAVRIVLDVSLHTGALTPEEASARLSREVGMTREEADAEVLRYCQTPAYNLSYMWGRLRIEALRERLLAAGWTERGFHDAFLGLGSIPSPSWSASSRPGRPRERGRLFLSGPRYQGEPRQRSRPTNTLKGNMG